MAMIDNAAETGKLIRRKRMKSNVVSSGTMRSRRTRGSSNRNDFRALPAHPGRHDQPRQREGREQGRDDADAQRHRESADRAGADEEQHGGGDEGGDVGIE